MFNCSVNVECCLIKIYFIIIILGLPRMKSLTDEVDLLHHIFKLKIRMQNLWAKRTDFGNEGFSLKNFTNS